MTRFASIYHHFPKHYYKYVHDRNKELSLQRKEEDKKKLKKTIHSNRLLSTFKAVLYLPCSNTSSFYYTRKITTYNLTFHNESKRQGTCYIQHGNKGRRESDEIEICFYLKNLIQLLEAVQHVLLYSCGGQNRDR